VAETAAAPSPQPAATRTQAPAERPEALQEGDTADAGQSQAALGFAEIAAWESRYLDGLRRAIEKNRYYPRKAHRRGREGQVLVSFVVQADGRITDIRVSEGSDWRSLDKAAVDALERLGRYEPIPAAFGREQWALRVPINFALK
jgi:protein TonB